MTGKKPHTLPSLFGALVLVCLLGSVLSTATVGQIEGTCASSINYAKQTILDSSPLPDRNVRSHFVRSFRNTRVDHGLIEPLFLSVLPAPYIISSYITELPVPQSLRLFHPPTRSPPC